MNKNEPLIIAVDMDGTLLNDKKRICKKTLFYLRKLSRKGHKIVISSGRPIRAIETYYKQLKIDTPIICYNGAYVFSPTDKKFPTHSFEFPKKLIIEISQKIKSHIKNIMCETNDEIWVDVEDPYLAKFFWYEGMNIHVGELKDTLKIDPMTCIVQTPKEYKDTREIDAILEKYPAIGARFWTGSPYFELFYKGISKGAGLKKIADYLGIPQSQVIAFGDSTNDIEMFDYAGTAVLMSNGKDKITNTDMLSVKDNNHNGIYWTLKKLLK